MDSIDPSVFKDMPQAQLLEIEQKLMNLKKSRHKEFIRPQQIQHFKPLREKYIKPLYKEHIYPINNALRELRKYIPKKKIWSFNGNQLNKQPLTKQEVVKLLLPISK